MAWSGPVGAWGANGKVLGVVACTVVDGRIVEILTVSDRKRLDTMGLPARPQWRM